MNTKKRILLGIVTTVAKEKFLNSYSKLLNENTEYDITTRFYWNHPIVIGNNMLAEECIKEGYDYLLLIGTKYHGFHIGMLTDMIEANADVATVRYRYETFPFTHLPMDFDDIPSHLLAVGERSGTREVAFAGLDFVLIKRGILK